MKPRNVGGADSTLMLCALALALIGFSILSSAKSVRRLEQRARSERARALELEERLSVREGQLDGALAHIAETRDPPADEHE